MPRRRRRRARRARHPRWRLGRLAVVGLLLWAVVWALGPAATAGGGVDGSGIDGSDGADGSDGTTQEAEAEEQTREQIEESRRLQEELQRQLEELEARQREIAERVRETQREIERRLEDEAGKAETEVSVEAEDTGSEDPLVIRERAEAPSRPRPPRARRADQKFSFGSTVKVREGEVAADVVSLGGGIKIDGEVRGGAVAVGGEIKVNGRVTGDVISFGEDVELGDEAEVLGNVVSVGGEVVRAPGARVVGEVSEVGLSGGVPWGDRMRGWSNRRQGVGPVFHMGDWLDLVGSLFGTALLIVIGALTILVAPAAVNRTANVAADEFFKALLVGLGVELLSLPALIVLTIVLAISIIGIPLLLLIPFVVVLLLLAAVFGYISVGVAVGRRLAGRLGVGAGRLAYLITGILAIQALTMVGEFLDGLGLPLIIYGLFGLIGFVLQFLAWTSGLGAAVLTRFGARGMGVRLPPIPETREWGGSGAGA